MTKRDGLPVARRGSEMTCAPRLLRTTVRAALSALAVVATMAGPGTAARAASNDGVDYDPHSTAWNGMASFVGLAEGMGFEVNAVSSLEWSELSSEDILVLIYPLQRVDPGRLGAFVQAGGNVVIADDFGEGKDAMQALGLLRADVTTPKATKFEGGYYALLAVIEPAPIQQALISLREACRLLRQEML